MGVAALLLDTPTLKTLLDFGVGANATEGTGGATALHVACSAHCWGDSMKHSFGFALLANSDHPLDKAIERGSSNLGHRVLQQKGGTTYGQLHIRQALGGAALRVVRLLLKHGGDPNALCTAVRIRRNMLLSGYCTGHVRVHDLTSRSLLVQIAAHARWVNAIEVHPMRDVMATVAEDCTVSVWRLPDGCYSLSDEHEGYSRTVVSEVSSELLTAKPLHAGRELSTRQLAAVVGVDRFEDLL